jgi:arylformamidase
MSFPDLRPQPPLYPQEAEDYARRALELSAAAVQQCERIADVPYGDLAEQTLDVYPARTARHGGSAVLVFAHGGAWTNGYKEWVALLAPPLNAAGITLVAPSYRLAPHSKWQDMVEDCSAAIAWVHHHIDRHGGDPRRIAVGGHSAGGHLTALTVLQGEGLRARGVPLASIVACLPLCAPLDIRYPDAQPGSGEERTHRMILVDPAQAAEASPICHLRDAMPFMLLAHAREDLPRIVAGTRSMEQALRLRGSAHETLLLDGDHFAPAIAAGDAQSPWTARVIQLLGS